MKSLKDYLNYLKSLIKIITSLSLIIFFLSTEIPAQEEKLIIEEEEVTDTIFVMQKSPWGAVLRSAILPGLGQFYNESYWKIPVIWGFAGWFIYNWVDTNDKYTANRDLFLQTDQQIYRLRRDFYRDQRDNFAIYLALTYLLNLVDAYVDAHLFDFTVTEDLLLGTPQLKVRVNF